MNDKKKEKKGKKKKIIIIGIIILIILIIILTIPKKKEEPKLETETIEKRDIATSISATGVISTDTSQNVLSSLAGFKIKTVNVKEGDKINAGDIICTFDVSDLERSLATAQSSLDIAQAQSNLGIQGANRSLNDAITNKDTQVSTTQGEVDAALKRYQDAQNQLNSAKNNLSNLQNQLAATGYDKVYKEYASIEATYKKLETEFNAATDKYNSQVAITQNAKIEYDSYSGSAPEEITKKYQDAQTNLVTAETELNSAKSAYYAYKPTYDQKLNEFTPIKNTYDSMASGVATAQASVSQLETTVSSLKSTYDTLVNTLNATVKTSDSTIASMQDALSNSQLSANLSTQTQQSQVQSLQDQIADGVLKSNVTGTVTSVSVKPGDLYSGTTIAVIEGVEVFVVEAEIDEYDIADIEEGMEVLIKTDATRDEELKGRVIYTASSATTPTMSSMEAASAGISTGSATYKVKIALDEQNDRLRLGMNARLSIITDSKEKVWSVPNDAVYEKEDGTKYIEILTDEKTGAKEELVVTTGIEGSYYIEINSDKLKNGMKVILPSGNSTDSVQALIELMGADAGL